MYITKLYQENLQQSVLNESHMLLTNASLEILEKN